MLRAPALYFIEKLHRPFSIDREDVIGNPHDVRVVRRLDHHHFVDDVARRPLPVCVAENFAGAPCTVKWTAPRRNQ